MAENALTGVDVAQGIRFAARDHMAQIGLCISFWGQASHLTLAAGLFRFSANLCGIVTAALTCFLSGAARQISNPILSRNR
jgi:hypothetical protein